MKCYFSEPVEVASGDFEFSEIDCEVSTPDAIFELVTNESYPGREFYVQKTLTYGEAIVIWFLTIFAIFLIAKTIFNFLWKK